MEQSTIMLFEKILTDMFSKNQEYIIQKIQSGTNKNMSTEEICGKMISNSIYLSTQFSVLFILDFFEKQDIISLNEREIQKILLLLSSSCQENYIYDPKKET